MEAMVAPELDGLTGWLQSSPLRLADMRGKVVALEFWTHGCSFCVHAAPRIQQIYDQFAQKGLAVVGVHTPEFDSEKDAVAIKKFLLHTHITYPIALDHELAVWNAYGNQYWPTLHLIDKQGIIRHTHVGDGGYSRIIQDIEHLLAE